MHKSFVITKPVDRSSPLLYNALAQNETIVQGELQFIAPASALPSPFYTVRLTNALISDIEFSFSDGANANPTVENVSFTYQKIEWVWNDGNIEATDTWQPATA
jgi:type VI secretion system secreted protein Hcp